MLEFIVGLAVILPWVLGLAAVMAMFWFVAPWVCRHTFLRHIYDPNSQYDFERGTGARLAAAALILCGVLLLICLMGIISSIGAYTLERY